MILVSEFVGGEVTARLFVMVGPPGQQTENPWADLGLPRGATKLEVKNAYMKLVQQYHPDKHMNSSHDERQRAEQYFKMVQHAYSLLTSKDSMHLNHTRQPAQWAQAAADEAMQKTAFTNRQIGLWVAGICFLSAGFVTCWTAVRRNYDDTASHDKKNIKVRERYCRQAKQWEHRYCRKAKQWERMSLLSMLSVCSA